MEPRSEFMLQSLDGNGQEQCTMKSPERTEKEDNNPRTTGNTTERDSQLLGIPRGANRQKVLQI